MIVLDDEERRVLGALVEKQIATPDYYPLTLLALTNACNQKNHRDPVVDYDEPQVERALERLRDKGLAYVFDGAVARVPKYGHTFAQALALEPPQVAVLCVLLLRGPQTPGELRSRTPHLFNFESLAAVEETLAGLSTRTEPLAQKLPRLPGTKESRYAHRLGGEINAEDPAPNAPASPVLPVAPPPISAPERVAKLETEVAALRQELADLRAQFAAFRQQFD